MDCCNYPEYRAQYAWECAGGYAPYAPLQYGYAPPCYAPHAHDPYARYGPTAAAAVGAGAYHYDYRAHHLGALPPDHGLPMDYGAYASKESRARRGLGRRETRRAQPHHLPLPPTPPLECGMGTRGAAYCDPHIWPPYQLGAMSAAGWSGVPSSAWGSRGREQSRRTFGFPSSIRRIDVFCESSWRGWHGSRGEYERNALCRLRVGGRADVRTAAADRSASSGGRPGRSARREARCGRRTAACFSASVRLDGDRPVCGSVQSRRGGAGRSGRDERRVRVRGVRRMGDVGRDVVAASAPDRRPSRDQVRGPVLNVDPFAYATSIYKSINSITVLPNE